MSVSIWIRLGGVHDAASYPPSDMDTAQALELRAVKNMDVDMPPARFTVSPSFSQACHLDSTLVDLAPPAMDCQCCREVEATAFADLR